MDKVKASYDEYLKDRWSKVKDSLLVEVENKDKFACLDTITLGLKAMDCLTAEEVEDER